MWAWQVSYMTPKLELPLARTPSTILTTSDGSLNEHHTSTHNPFGTGKLDFDKLLPALNKAGVPNDWWVVDLCFWPNAWEVTADAKTFLDKMRKKHAS